MMILPPTEQFDNDYIFATPDDEKKGKKEFNSTVNIVVKSDSTKGLVVRCLNCFLDHLFSSNFNQLLNEAITQSLNQ